MRFTYDFYKEGVRVDTASRIDPSKQLESNENIKVTDNVKNVTYYIRNNEELDNWFETLARVHAWKPEKEEPTHIPWKLNESKFSPKFQGEPTLTEIIDRELRDEGVKHLHINDSAAIQPTSKETSINPNHYKNIVPGLQYMEMMQYMLDDVESHLMGQIYKYLMRNGKKDHELKELKKSRWYLDFLIAYIENGRYPIQIADVARLKDD